MSRSIAMLLLLCAALGCGPAPTRPDPAMHPHPVTLGRTIEADHGGEAHEHSASHTHEHSAECGHLHQKPSVGIREERERELATRLGD